MDVDEARRILGVDQRADRETVRDAHRRAIRRVHPDAGGSEAAARRVNAAWETLRHLDRDATEPDDPAPAPPSAADPVPAPVDVDQWYRVDAAPDDLLARLADAGHDVGEVVFVDPHVGLLEIVVGEPPAVGQLAVSVGNPSPAGTEVTFTLEPLGVTPAPPIADVVDALMAAVRR